MEIPEREESDQGIKNPVEEILTENFPNLVMEKIKHISPGSSENPKQVGLNEIYTETHHN